MEKKAREASRKRERELRLESLRCIVGTCSSSKCRKKIGIFNMLRILPHVPPVLTNIQKQQQRRTEEKERDLRLASYNSSFLQTVI